MGPVIPLSARRPNWSARQPLAAADLIAEQDWQDAELVRLRRYALGFGVMAGFEVRASDEELIVGPGYGLTAAGGEVYLPEPVDWPDAKAALMEACGTAPGCDDPRDSTERAEDESPVTGWLVLRGASYLACPRPTVPDGCAHPASATAYARRGAEMRLEIVCDADLPNIYRATQPDCAASEARLAGTAPVPLPGPADDWLALAQLTCADGMLMAETALRRRLLPLWAMQDLAICRTAASPVPDPDPDPDPDPEPDPDPGPVPDPVPWDRPSEASVPGLLDTIVDHLGETALRATVVGIFDDPASPRVDPRSRLPVGMDSGRRVASTEVLRGLAAALLVGDETDLSNFLTEAYTAIWSRRRKFVVPRLQLNPLFSGATARADLAQRARNVTGQQLVVAARPLVQAAPRPPASEPRTGERTGLIGTVTGASPILSIATPIGNDRILEVLGTERERIVAVASAGVLGSQAAPGTRALGVWLASQIAAASRK